MSESWEERMAARAAARRPTSWEPLPPDPGVPEAVEAWLTEHAMTRIEAEEQLAALAGVGCACWGSPIQLFGAPCNCALWRMCRERAGVTP